MRQSFAPFRTALYAPIFCCALLAAGCASLPPPTAELDAARQAVAGSPFYESDVVVVGTVGRLQTVKDQLADDFIYASVSPTYLAGVIDIL